MLAMPKFACPNCHPRVRVEERQYGKALRCPTCKGRFAVDPALPVGIQLDDYDADAPPDKRSASPTIGPPAPNPTPPPSQTRPPELAQAPAKSAHLCVAVVATIAGTLVAVVVVGGVLLARRPGLLLG